MFGAGVVRRRASPRGRSSGLLLLLVAALTAVVVPRFDGTLTGGSATAAPVAPPPQVAACVSRFVTPATPATPGNPSTPATPDAAQNSAASADSPSVVVPSAVYGSCSGAIAGEVLSVQSAAHLGDEVSPAAYDSASMGCAQEVDEYLGAPAGLNSSPTTTQWLPAARYNTLLVGPDAEQRAAGRTWSACVVTTVASTSYARPVRHAFAMGALADQFGYCLNSTDLSDWLPCSDPHSAQVLVWGTAATAGSQPAKADCQAAAALLMQTEDPTKGGTLDVGLISYEGAGSVQACGVRVAGGRRLIGSVVGIKEALPALTG